VRNYQARNLMRDEMKLGDQVLFYHSSCDVPGAIGTATVVKESHPDLTALNPKSEYYDEKSAKDGASRWMMVSVKAGERFKNVVTLATMRQTKGLEKMVLLKPGMRLSVQPVTKAEFDLIVRLGSR
jgi:predicted RNA-binding protein with PUA-like domain